MFNKLRCNRTAFTLIELLAALAVLSMLVVMLFLAFTNCNRMMVLGSNQMEKNQVVRAVLQQISRDIERTAYFPRAVNLYQASAATETISGTGISNCTLYCLSTLTTEEGNVLGSVVNVGYQATNVATVNYGVPVQKWVLQRGDDAYVDQNGSPTTWWTNTFANSTFWKTISDNVLGVAFQFYTNRDLSAASWSSTNLPNSLPTSVGITIWAIDSDNYNRALTLSPSLTATDPQFAAAVRILTNNIHQYSSRVFLPQSTQN